MIGARAVLRPAGALALAAVALTAGARPAGADPARPTDYRSRIDAIDPALPAGVSVAVVGGDAFLRVSVAEGHTALVEGYDGEPYLQFLADGTVQENRRSEAAYLNEDRYAQVDVPATADNDAPPDWRTVDTDGEHAWHDHRIHWMSPDRPPGVATGDVVQTNEVALEVDGTPTTVTVSVVLEPGESPLPWIGIGAVVAGALLAAGWRRRSLAVPAVAATAGAVLAVAVGRGELSSMPSGTGASPLVVVVPAVGLGAAVVAGALLALRRASLAGVALLAGAAALAGWALLRLSVLAKPVLPTDLPADLDRTGTVVAVAVAVAVAVLTIRSGAITPAPLSDDD